MLVFSLLIRDQICLCGDVGERRPLSIFFSTIRLMSDFALSLSAAPQLAIRQSVGVDHRIAALAGQR